MSAGMPCAPIDWAEVRLVAFDVDGTLYRQRKLRLRMAFELVAHAVRSRDATALSVVRHYRRLREHMAEKEVVDSAAVLVAQTASACGVREADVRLIVAEWIDRRPLRHLAACRFPGLIELFAALRRHGKSIGVLSDYPAVAKLQALGLAADHVVCADDQGIGVLKPHPKGLLALIEAAGATPQTTVLIGDRPERDGRAAKRAGVPILIRSARPIEGWPTFRRFDDALFLPLLAV